MLEYLSSPIKTYSVYKREELCQTAYPLLERKDGTAPSSSDWMPDEFLLTPLPQYG